MKTLIVRTLRILVFYAALSGTASQGADLAIPIVQGWNLLGNTGTSAIDVAAVLGDGAKVATVWKWNSQAAAWAFYAPSLAADGTLATYAAGKSYQVLASIAPGEGFWLNAAQAFTLSRPGIVPYSLGPSSLVQGWNLLATGDALSPAQLDTKLGGVTGTPSFSSMWAWDSTSSKWYFYAPASAASSGLASYIQTKGYLDFGSATTENGLGFWLNSNLTGASATDKLFLAPPSPVNVAVTTDAARATSQVVTAAGGTLNATAANGSQFTLVIPAGALTQDTTIRMVPIASISGLPLATGLVAGVQFEPDGLFFEKDATLTIVPSTEVPVMNQTFLGYLGGGSDLHLVPPAVPTAAIQMRVRHFSGMLLGNGTTADRVSLSQSRPASDEARLTQELAKVLGEERQLQLVVASDGTADGSKSPDYFGSYYTLVVRPLVDAASISCADARLARQVYLEFEGKYQVVMGVESPHDLNNADLNTIVAAMDANCRGVPNRYSGTFTTELPGQFTSRGTVTYVRDDAACAAALPYDAATSACYRTEVVSFTFTWVQAVCPIKMPASYDVTMSNTSVLESYLMVDLAASPTGLRHYSVDGHWGKIFPQGLTLTCPPDPDVMTLDGAAQAAIYSDPTGTTTANAQLLQQSYSLSSYIYSWSLSGGQ